MISPKKHLPRHSQRKRLRRALLSVETLEPRNLLTAELVSVTPDLFFPEAGSDYSSNPVISADGRFIAFQSHADNLTTLPDTNGTQDVFVRDLLSGETTLISRNVLGTDSGACEGTCAASTVSGSFDPAMSDDGRFIAFVSNATDLTDKPIESGPTPNVFVHDRDTDEDGIFDEIGASETRLLSVAVDGSAAGVVAGNPSRPVISGNGAAVAFVSASTEMDTAEGLPLSGINAFLATVSTGGVQLLTDNSAGTASGSGGSVIDLSIDDSGTIVAFASSKPDLTSTAAGSVTDTNGAILDIFVADKSGVEVVSVNSDESGTGDMGSREASISGNGRHVAFFSSATNLAKGATDSNLVEDLYVRDLATGITSLVSRSADASPLMTGDGATPPSSLLDNDSSAGPMLSDNGRFVVFRSAASDLLASAGGVVDENGVSDIFRYDRDPDMDGVFDEPGETVMELVSINSLGTGSTGHGDLPPSSAGSYAPAVSANGRYVSFVSTGIELVPGVSGTHVYVRDMIAGTTSLVSATPDGLTASVAGTTPPTWISVISGDGTRTAFQSDRDAGDLDPTVTDPLGGSPVPFAELDVFAGKPPTDIRATRNFASGFETHFQVVQIEFDDAPPFDVSYYLSSDALFDAGDSLLAALPITAPEDLAAGGSVVLTNTLGIGVGEVPLPGAGSAETTEDYYLLAVADPTDAIAEFDGDPFNEDNVSALRGVYHLPGGPVLAHGGPRGEALVATVVGDTVELSYGFVGGSDRVFTYDLADIAELRLRTHAGDDLIVGSELGDVAFGGEGSDRLIGNDGDDELFGGPGADFLDGGPGADLVDGGPGPDEIFGGPGDDILFDGPGDDLIDVGEGDDTVFATPGSDDIFIGVEDGINTIDFSLADHAIELDLDLESVAQTVDEPGNTITLVGHWENFVGSPFDDTVYISPVDLLRDVFGGDGRDRLIVDAKGGAVIDDGSQISFPGSGLGSIVYDGFESITILNHLPSIIDDEDFGYSSTFTHIDNPSFPQGFNGDVEFSAPDDGNTATWTFSNIPNGQYLVAATWTSAPDRSSQAPFTIFDGTNSDPILKEVAVNQELLPREFPDQGVGWGNLGLVNITGTTLTVQLDDVGAADGGDDPNEFVIADAIRIEPIRSGIQIIDNLDSGFSSDGQQQSGIGAFSSVHGSLSPPLGSEVGTWTFSGLAQGRYLVSATWPEQIATASTNSEFTIGSGGQTSTKSVNQFFAPGDLEEGGISWEHLGTVDVNEGGTLNVELNGISGLVIADAIRVAPAPSVDLILNSTIPLSPSTNVDLGAVGFDPATGLADEIFTFTLENTGAEPVHIFPPNATGPFSVITPPLGFGQSLPPRAKQDFSVQLLTNQLGEARGELRILNQSWDQFQFNPVFDLTAQVIEDTTPPSVTVQAPGDGASFIEGTRIDVQVDVSDDVQIRSVELLADGTPIQFLDQAPFDFQFDLPSIGSLGTDNLLLTARAADTSGNTTVSDDIRVHLVEDLPPQVTFASPQPMAEFHEGSSIPIHVQAVDDVAVVRVEFRMNNVLLDTFIEEPFFGHVVVPPAPSAFEIEAVVEDSFGNITNSFLPLNSIIRPNPLVAPDSIIVGADRDQPPVVRVLDPNGDERMEFFAYDANFVGGVRVATGDVNGDGIADIITGAGPGGGPHVKVFDGLDGVQLDSFFAFDPSFSGGVFVAAGDVTGDGLADAITSAGPDIKIFTDAGTGFTPFRELQPFPGFNGGVFVAAGDVNADGQADIISGAGAGSGPQVKVFDGHSGVEVSRFFAFDPGFTGGVRVATGDVNHDGIDDIITGAGPGMGPEVRVFDPTDGSELQSFFAYEPSFLGGVFVAASDINADGQTDVITVQDDAAQKQVIAFNDGVDIGGSFAQIENSSDITTVTNSPPPLVIPLPAGGGIYNLDRDLATDEVVLSQAGNELARVNPGSQQVIRVHGAPGADDQLVIGSPFQMPRIIYDGGLAGNDSLRLAPAENQNPIQFFSYQFADALVTDFRFGIQRSALPQIKAVDLEPIIDDLPVVDRWFQFPPSADQIVFNSGDDPNDQILRIDSDNSEVVDFVVPVNSVTIESSANDTIAIAGQWTYQGTANISGQFARQFVQGGLTLQLIGPDHWSNPIDGLDTNASGEVSPVDALIVINQLNLREFEDESGLVDPLGLPEFPGIFIDVNADGFASPIDALLVINALNQRGVAEGEWQAAFEQSQSAGNPGITPSIPNGTSLSVPLEFDDHQVFDDDDLYELETRVTPPAIMIASEGSSKDVMGTVTLQRDDTRDSNKLDAEEALGDRLHGHFEADHDQYFSDLL